MHSEELCYHTVKKIFVKNMKSLIILIIAIITYAIFIIDMGTAINQQLSNLEMVVPTSYLEGRRACLILWNKGHGNSSYDMSMNIKKC